MQGVPEAMLLPKNRTLPWQRTNMRWMSDDGVWHWGHPYPRGSVSTPYYSDAMAEIATNCCNQAITLIDPERVTA